MFLTSSACDFIIFFNHRYNVYAQIQKKWGFWGIFVFSGGEGGGGVRYIFGNITVLKFIWKV